MTSTTKITIAGSARTLFNFEAENQLFREDDPSAYCALQAMRLDVPAAKDALPNLCQGDGLRR
jgi:5'-nucleotidase